MRPSLFVKIATSGPTGNSNVPIVRRAQRRACGGHDRRCIETINLVCLVADAVLYFAVLSALFRLRAHLGIGAFFCALGVMHFLETYLASVFYVALPFGIVTSPGSTVLFTGKLMLLLLVYIREDAVVVRQPIYGLLVGNLLLVVLAYLMRNHALDAARARARRRSRLPQRDGRADGVGHRRSCSSTAS